MTKIVESAEKGINLEKPALQTSDEKSGQVINVDI